MTTLFPDPQPEPIPYTFTVSGPTLLVEGRVVAVFGGPSSPLRLEENKRLAEAVAKVWNEHGGLTSR